MAKTSYFIFSLTKGNTTRYSRQALFFLKNETNKNSKNPVENPVVPKAIRYSGWPFGLQYCFASQEGREWASDRAEMRGYGTERKPYGCSGCV